MSFDCCGSGEVAGETFADVLENVLRVPRAVYASFYRNIEDFAYGCPLLFIVVAIVLLISLFTVAHVHVTPPSRPRLEE